MTNKNSTPEELTAGISSYTTDLNTLMRSAVSAGLKIWLETHSLPGPCPQISIRVYKPPGEMNKEKAK